MSQGLLTYLWDNVTDRFLTEGAIYRELRDLRGRIERLEDWPAAWAETAAETERRAAVLMSYQGLGQLRGLGILWRNHLLRVQTRHACYERYQRGSETERHGFPP